MTYLIQPMEQKVIHYDPLYKPKDVLVLDQLNDDLTHDRQLATAAPQESPSQFLKRLVSQGQVKPGGWVKMKSEDLYSWEDLWPLAMKQLGNKNVLINSKNIDQWTQ